MFDKKDLKPFFSNFVIEKLFIWWFWKKKNVMDCLVRGKVLKETDFWNSVF